MNHLICELWEGGRQVAEFELSDLNHLSNEQMDAFWTIQSELNRYVMLKYKDDDLLAAGVMEEGE